MDMEEQAKHIIDAARERLQSRYPECSACRHRGEKHAMNCIECCPVERTPSCKANVADQIYLLQRRPTPKLTGAKRPVERLVGR